MTKENKKAQKAIVSKATDSAVVRSVLAPTLSAHLTASNAFYTLVYHRCYERNELLLRVEVQEGEHTLDGEDFYNGKYSDKIKAELEFLAGYLANSIRNPENAKRVLKGKEVCAGEGVTWIDFAPLKARGWETRAEGRNPYHYNHETVPPDALLVLRPVVAIDASNILMSKYFGATLAESNSAEWLEKLVDQLLAKRKELQAKGQSCQEAVFQVAVFLDRSIYEELSNTMPREAHRLDGLKLRVERAGGVWHLGSPRSSVDRALLEYAKKKDGLVVSRDRFCDWPLYHERFLEAGDAPRLVKWKGDSTHLEVPALGINLSL